MAVKVGINGFGRIGRLVFRVMADKPEKFDIPRARPQTSARS